VTRSAGVAAAVAVSMTLGGMLSAAAFNSVLGRGEYSDDSVWTWFSIGLRSVVMPLALLAMSATAVGLCLAIRRILMETCEPFARIDAAIGARGIRIARRLALDKPAIAACWLLLLTTMAALIVWNHWLPLLQAVTDYMSRIPAERLYVLSPASVDYRQYYRVALSLVVVANLVAWYALARASRWRQQPLPVWFKPGEIAVLVLLIGSMMIPYRLMHDNNEFEAVRWNGEPCHVLGRGQDDVLLFCPRLTPRNRVVPPAAIQLDKDRKGHGLFYMLQPPPGH